MPKRQLNLGLNIRIPAEYITEENQRLRMYKRVAGVETESQLADVAAELRDRYGEPPPTVRNLLDYASLKLLVLARRRRCHRAQARPGQHPVSPRTPTSMPRSWRASFPRTAGAQFTPDGVLKFTLKATAPTRCSSLLRDLIEELAVPVC